MLLLRASVAPKRCVAAAGTCADTVPHASTSVLLDHGGSCHSAVRARKQVRQANGGGGRGGGLGYDNTLYASDAVVEDAREAAKVQRSEQRSCVRRRQLARALAALPFLAHSPAWS